MKHCPSTAARRRRGLLNILTFGMADRTGHRAVRNRREAVELFDNLGVPGAGDLDPLELRTEYRRLARTHHPDRNPDRIPEATQILADLNSAHEILTTGRAGPEQPWEAGEAEEPAGFPGGAPQPFGAMYMDEQGRRLVMPEGPAQAVFRIQMGMGGRADWRVFSEWAQANGLQQMFDEMSRAFGGAEALAGGRHRRLQGQGNRQWLRGAFSDPLMPSRKFWATIKSTGWGTRTTDHEAAKQGLLDRLGVEEGVAFSETYREVKRRLKEQLWDRVTNVGDDSYDDLVSHIIGLGKKEVDAVVKDPQRAQVRADFGKGWWTGTKVIPDSEGYSESFSYAVPYEEDWRGHWRRDPPFRRGKK